MFGITGVTGLRMAYQPVFDAQGNIVFHEALARFPCDQGEVMSPDDAIPRIHRSGEFRAFTLAVIEEVFSHRDTWRRVSINVPPESLKRWFFDAVVDALGRYGIDPDAVIVEVTEHNESRRYDAESVGVVHAFDAIGISVILDDYVGSWWQYAMACDCRFVTIKTDKSVLWEKGRKGLRMVCGQLRELGVCRFVVEGVENAEHAGVVCSMRDGTCPGMEFLEQGFLYGEPGFLH